MESPGAFDRGRLSITEHALGIDLRDHPCLAVVLPRGENISVRYKRGSVVYGTRDEVRQELRELGFRVCDDEPGPPGGDDPEGG